MIKLNDLKNRIYSDRNCIRFEYEVPNGESKTTALFKKQQSTENGDIWRMQIVFDRNVDKDSEVYNFTYVLPKANIPLELIAATGLRYFQLRLKEEIQNKSNMDFTLGDILSGM